ncbi:hypothetical protein D3C85_1638740 [compost metagenome]
MSMAYVNQSGYRRNFFEESHKFILVEQGEFMKSDIFYSKVNAEFLRDLAQSFQIVDRSRLRLFPVKQHRGIQARMQDHLLSSDSS